MAKGVLLCCLHLEVLLTESLVPDQALHHLKGIDSMCLLSLGDVSELHRPFLTWIIRSNPQILIIELKRYLPATEELHRLFRKKLLLSAVIIDEHFLNHPKYFKSF